MIRKLFSTAFAVLALCSTAAAQQSITKAFKPAVDSVYSLVSERTTVKSRFTIDKVLERDGKLDIYFTPSISDFHWSSDDVKWLKKTLKKLAPAEYRKYEIGGLYYKGGALNELVTPDLASDGKAKSYQYSRKDPKSTNPSFITEIGAQKFDKGLSGRYISVWHSHGRYFEAKTNRWEWQRAPNHRTVEDMYTQSYVLPFVIPMLENAGAYVIDPRERDTQCHESICDNDPTFAGEREPLVRTKGAYAETGDWKDAGEGFADAQKVYSGLDNPFAMGTARSAECAKNSTPTATATWTPDIPETGEYAVYISYKTLEHSTTAAHYTVRHRRGVSEFAVNQQLGGGTFTYLGTFEFEKGQEGCITLDNALVEGHKYVKNSVISADAVKVGGGMGKIARGLDDEDPANYTTSGMPCFAEGAIYWMQFAGVDNAIWHGWDTDYTSDYASRGAWTAMMSAGSQADPKGKGKGIPVDLSLGFHTDAGTTMDDSTIGCLSIYTLMCDDSRKLPNGESRMSGRLLADLVQQQICDDVRADFDTLFNKRMLWDRSYSESRTSGVPGMLLELLSHQNFADMKYGLDPTYRFTVSRAIYKGMLKTISDMYGVPYVVQPLPVGAFSAKLDGLSAQLSWKATEDPKEPTASPTGYILYTRVDDGPFDQGIILEDVKAEGEVMSKSVAIEAGHVYSFKVVAFNEGGRSFPSEVLCAARPASANAQNALVVNNFDRVSAPTWFDTQEYAGFDGKTDGGVAYGHEINYIGENYQFRRDLPWMDDDNPGFGASFSNMAGKLIPGNTFDFVYSHAVALLEAGCAVSSQSRDAFTAAPESCSVVDILCGKQVTTKVGRGAVPNRFQVFPEALQQAIRKVTSEGSNIIISGANIGTDVWDKVYPIEVDGQYVAQAKEFVTSVLGYKWLSGHASYTGEVGKVSNKVWNMKGIDKPFAFQQQISTEPGATYCVENPDGILPADANGALVLRYTGNEVGAAVGYTAKGYKVMSFGFPIEVVCDAKARAALMSNAVEFFSR